MASLGVINMFNVCYVLVSNMKEILLLLASAYDPAPGFDFFFELFRSQ